MKQQKINTTIIIFVFVILIISFLFLLNQNRKLQNILWQIQWDHTVDITPKNNNFDLEIFQNSINKSISQNYESIVWIYANKNIEYLNESSGSQKNTIETIKTLQWNGIIITEDWYILTNQHNVNDKKSTYYVKYQNQEYLVDKIRYDELIDIAVIKIKTTEKLQKGNITSIEQINNIWDIVFAIKNDTENNEFVTKMGIINSKKQKFKEINNKTYVGLIQTSTAIEPWFSGWPLININWEIIWLNTAINNIEYWASYSLPINQELINQTLSSIKDSQKIIRPYIGIEYQQDQSGIKVTKVIPWSNAQTAWLEVWDIIYGINNKDINYYSFLYELYTYKINKNIILNTQKTKYKEDIQIKLTAKED